MAEIEEIDNELYEALYGNRGNYWEIWEKIKNNPDILIASIQVTKNKRNKFTLKGLTIAETMLINYNCIDNDIYQELIKTIFSNKDIARSYRKSLDSNSKWTFLEIALNNKELILTKNQKEFAYNEVKYNLKEYECKPFDIRYLILTNSNWCEDEKNQLAIEFYTDYQYEKYIDIWESNIINNTHNFKGTSHSLFTIDNLYEYTYNNLLNFYKDKRITDAIWKQIEFCRTMRKIRTSQKKIEDNEKVKKLK